MDPNKPLSFLQSAFPWFFFTQCFADPQRFREAPVEFGTQGAPGLAGEGATALETLQRVIDSPSRLRLFLETLERHGTVEDFEVALKNDASGVRRGRMHSKIVRLGPGDYFLQCYCTDASNDRDPGTPGAPASGIQRPGPTPPTDTLEGDSRAILKVRQAVAAYGGLETEVWLFGEPGVGKKRIARAIHVASPRAQGPFLSFHCDALPEILVESALFGHIPGAFPGAVQASEGLLEAAHGGSLYLEAPETLPRNTHLKLLKALTDKEIRKLGSTRSLRVDVRVFAGTCGVEPGGTAACMDTELFHRLERFALPVPPLRERAEDVLTLADRFLADFAARQNRTAPRISKSAALLLKSYSWPGNLRELKNTLQRAAALCEGDWLEDHHLAVTLPGGIAAPPEGRQAGPEDPAGGEKQKILRCLEKNRWNRTRTARELHISRATLWRKIKEWSLSTS